MSINSPINYGTRKKCADIPTISNDCPCSPVSIVLFLGFIFERYLLSLYALCHYAVYIIKIHQQILQFESL